MSALAMVGRSSDAVDGPQNANEEHGGGGGGRVDLSAILQNAGVLPNLVGMLNQAPSASNFPPFVPIRPIYAPSGYGRQILIYDSRAYPGCRREFAYKTRFTNQSGLTTVYYRCMACRALRHRLQRMMPRERLPAVPCIAVKNDMLINDPDWPEASDHFCSPLTIEESNNRLKVTFERGFKRARMKAAAEETMKKPAPASQTPPRTAGIRCEINESTTSPINMDQWSHWINNMDKVKLEEDDGTAQSTSSNEAGKDNDHLSHSNTSASATSPTTSPIRNLDDIELDNTHTSPKNRLDALLQLQEQRNLERDKSHSPDENLNNLNGLNIQNFAKLFDGTQATDLMSTLFNLSGITASLPTPPPQAAISTPTKGRPGAELMRALNKVQSRKKEKEAAAAAALHAQQTSSDYVEKYIKNNWQMPEDSALTSFRILSPPSGTNARSSAEFTCSLIMCLAKHIPQATSALKNGRCSRRAFLGDDLYGKTLAIIGLGKIGTEVAVRMQAFGMKCIGFDPVVSKQEVERRGIRFKLLDEIWPEADYITLHCPLLPPTTNLISQQSLAKCKFGVRIVNTARADIVNESDLLEALNSGRCGGAAIDTVVDETKLNKSLLHHPKVIITPSLCSSHVEVKEETANSTGASSLFSTLNASALAAVLDESKVQSVKAATNLGLLLASLESNPTQVTLRHPASAQGFKKALIAGAIVGVMQARGQQLTPTNAEEKAKEEGITVHTEQVPRNELTLESGSSSVTGYTSPAGTLISAICGRKLPSPVIAVNYMAVSVSEDDAMMDDTLKTKASVEYNLIGGGRVAFFTDLSETEVLDLQASNFVVVKFS